MFSSVPAVHALVQEAVFHTVLAVITCCICFYSSRSYLYRIYRSKVVPKGQPAGNYSAKLATYRSVLRACVRATPDLPRTWLVSGSSGRWTSRGLCETHCLGDSKAFEPATLTQTLLTVRTSFLEALSLTKSTDLEQVTLMSGLVSFRIQPIQPNWNCRYRSWDLGSQGSSPKRRPLLFLSISTILGTGLGSPEGHCHRPRYLGYLAVARTFGYYAYPARARKFADRNDEV